MRIGPLNELILDKAKEGSPDRRKVIKIGLSLVAASYITFDYNNLSLVATKIMYSGVH